jgi:hypothetical protein
VVVRSRLNYKTSAGTAVADNIPFGEVEDDEVLNFVEDFDLDLHVVNTGLYVNLGGWSVITDPDLSAGAWCGPSLSVALRQGRSSQQRLQLQRRVRRQLCHGGSFPRAHGLDRVHHKERSVFRTLRDGSVNERRKILLLE